MTGHPEGDILDFPPFPVMRWSDCDWWEGRVDLQIGTDVELCVTPLDPSVTRRPSDSQAVALKYQLENGSRVTQAVLQAVREYYGKVRPHYLSFLGATANKLMPAVKKDADLRKLIKLNQLHHHPWSQSDVAYVGLQFECSWDREHGLGVLMLKDQVVDVGGADVPFAWRPADVDDDKPTRNINQD